MFFERFYGQIVNQLHDVYTSFAANHNCHDAMVNTSSTLLSRPSSWHLSVSFCKSRLWIPWRPDCDTKKMQLCKLVLISKKQQQKQQWEHDHSNYSVYDVLIGNLVLCMCIYFFWNPLVYNIRRNRVAWRRILLTSLKRQLPIIPTISPPLGPGLSLALLWTWSTVNLSPPFTYFSRRFTWISH